MQKKLCLLFFIVILLPACSAFHRQTADGPPAHAVDVSHIPNATPRVEPISKYGNPPEYRVDGVTYHVMNSSRGYEARGIASWYGTKFHKKRTSSGEPYDMLAMTAAHPSLPLPTYVRVTNLENGKQVIVKVNDRGPFRDNRLIDLSYAAAKKLDITQKGTGLVQIDAIDPLHPEQRFLAPTVPHHIYLQVGAFQNPQNAEKIETQIRRLTAYPIAIRSENNLYKVVIGPIPNVDITDQLTDQIQSKGYGRAFAVIA